MAGSAPLLSVNPHARRPVPAEAWLARGEADAADAAVRGWAGYAPTPLCALPGLAARLGVASVRVKLEGARFEVGSFKALGPPYALARELARQGGATGWTAVAATSGNHGRALAWGARWLGAACRIFMPAHASAGRAAAIRGFGAEVVRVAGDFDDALAAAAAAAAQPRHVLVADLPFRGRLDIPRDVLAGYAVLGGELVAQMAADRPTHVFVAAGNGTLAAAIGARLALEWGDARPLVGAVEPLASDAIRRSLAAGARVGVAPAASLMDGLVVRMPSAVAWPFLRAHIDFAIAIDDAAAHAALRGAAAGAWGDAPLAIGETGVAALAGVIAACGERGTAGAAGLGADSHVCAIVCEGVTDAAVFAELTR